jgi:bifunctional N-acetylglucosamine-1-phosphate-uridyltransferase/glucosamine-1-phosphate-acetyltransferase GlmU-like protein
MADDPSQPEQEKSLEMRVSELEDRLAQLHITEDEVKAFEKVSAALGQGTTAPAVTPNQGFIPNPETCTVRQCIINQCTIRACTIVSNCTIISQCTIRACTIQQCTIINQCTINQCTIQQCINECGGGLPGGGGIGGGGFGQLGG